jgi:hypothetical protein
MDLHRLFRAFRPRQQAALACGLALGAAATQAASIDCGAA